MYRTKHSLTILIAASGLLLFLLILNGVPTPVFVQALAALARDNETAGKDDGRRHVGRRIAGFRLSDYLGGDHQLEDFSDSRLVVVAFLGTECPLAKLYGPRLVELAEKYQRKGVTFIGINSNQQDTPTEIGHYARRHGIKFPLLKDPGNKVADQFRAERTPEVFVLDDQRVVRYWGRIDDQFGVGYTRADPTRHFLAAAIDALLVGTKVSKPQSQSVGCHIGRVARTEPIGDITYSNQISRILQRRCVECHRDGGIAPFAMDSYAEVAGWAETMLEVVQDQRMPPWHANPKFGHFSNDGRMPEKEKQLLAAWVANGIPEGSPDDLPPPAEFVDGWGFGQPDLVISMPEPITVPANEVVPYQYITIDPGFKEGKWVRASEVRPGVRSVVHHVIVFINPPGGDPILEEQGIGFETVGSYVPGAPPMELEDGVARYVPAGSKLVFQMHYTPDGSEQRDQSEIGLYFADPSTIRRTMQTGVAANLEFVIPPNAEAHRVQATTRFSHETEIHALVPHMHYRGKSFRFEAIYPNGSREVLLDVPRFDFNWQNTYRLAKPKLMPEGTLLKCIAYFDNSDSNLSNPDPSIPVRWGEQTWEEMMIGYFEGVFMNQDLSLPEPQITALGNGDYRVRFTYRPDRALKSVHVAGTFNEWNTSSHPFTDADGDGLYTADVRLKAGEYRYKLVVDGNYWTHDPASRILTGVLHESFFVVGKVVKQ
jgi:peroxiredoxin